MPVPKTLDKPEIQAKRAKNARFVHLVTVKCAEWGKANGYADLLAQLDSFMAAYKAAHTAPDYYESQTPERLMEMIADARRRMDRAMGALTSKKGNGHF